ncbi:MAG: NmrA family NAD(P)-binding protein [Rhodospirillaceae bacterium]|nr:NmrA family NAD(P)-binding protein [Rhodospirillaceae bacterium]
MANALKIFSSNLIVCAALSLTGTVIAQTGLESAEKPLILVTGITGNQGGAVARELQRRGFPLRGLSRDIEKAESVKLAESGIEMVQDDFNDPESVRRAADGVHGMFLVLPQIWQADEEVRMGTDAIDAAIAAGVQHLVYSSSGAGHPVDGFPEAAKMQIGRYLSASGTPYTIVMPGTFMEGFLPIERQLEILRNGYGDGQSPEATREFVALEDVGFIVGEIFGEPEPWLGVAQHLAGDSVSGTELAAIFSRVSGRDIEFRVTEPPFWMMGMLEWMQQQPDVEPEVTALRERYPRLSTLEEFLREHRWGH